MWRAYYRLTKPGIIYGNLLTAAAGFLLACGWHIHWELFFSLIFGLGLIIGSACVFNNIGDQDIDRKMDRTKKRALVTGRIKPPAALLFATVLGILGFLTISLKTNLVATILALIGYVDYIFLYGYAKRHTVHSTVIGSISGAVPIAVGYTAVTARFDLTAILLFMIMVFWQMPHFYAIAMYRYKDYKAANLPVLTVSQGMSAARLQILIYIAAFMAAIIGLTIFGPTGIVFMLVMSSLGGYWLVRGIKGTSQQSYILWGRQMFGISLIVMMSLSVMVAVGGLLP